MTRAVEVLDAVDGILNAPVIIKAAELRRQQAALREVRAAVAELIDKSAAAARTLEESSNATDRFKGRMLTSALARVGGAP